jgi:hypothetical protein
MMNIDFSNPSHLSCFVVFSFTFERAQVLTPRHTKQLCSNFMNKYAEANNDQSEYSSPINTTICLMK